eukprot:g14993.t1
MLAGDGTGVGEGKGNLHFMGWVFREAARDAGVLAESYESACVLMHVTGSGKVLTDEQRKWSRCPVRSPLWNNGTNHVMVDFGDDGRHHRPEVADSFAMDASSNMHSCVYRSGYDISLPLAPRKYFHALADIPPLDRRFFLTFKGSVYLSKHGSEERLSVVQLHDEQHGVVMSVNCFEKHGEHLLSENVEYCQSLKDRYGNYDYNALMDTTFGLVPAGRSPGTYRLAEVGPYMMDTLRAVSQRQLEEMQHRSVEAYRRMFGHDDTLKGPSAFGPIAKYLIDIIDGRIGHRGGR